MEVMDAYPLNLVLAVATASATIFLGFLPTKTISNAFFARETLKAAIAWLAVAVLSPPAILHYDLFFAIVCGGAWWKFRQDNALSGKMWLSIASGLGISMGIILLLAVTPRAYPPLFTQTEKSLLLASMYLGGAIIGGAYISLVLTGISQPMVQRYVSLLMILTFARAAALIGSCFLSRIGIQPVSIPAGHYPYDNFLFAHESRFYLALIVLVGLLMPLAFLAQRATRLHSRIEPSRFLVAILLLGLIAEILARVLIL